jgi:hypothetical protein
MSGSRTVQNHKIQPRIYTDHTDFVRADPRKSAVPFASACTTANKSTLKVQASGYLEGAGTDLVIQYTEWNCGIIDVHSRRLCDDNAHAGAKRSIGWYRVIKDVIRIQTELEVY